MSEERRNSREVEVRREVIREREIYTEERGRTLPEVSELEIPSELPTDDD